MIVTELYNGQGLGNQLWSYVVTRVLAADMGVDFGILGAEKFKGKDFLTLDFGNPPPGGEGPEGGPPTSLPEGILHYFVERELWHKKFKCDVRDYDAALLCIQDNTKIEGYFQSERYIEHRKEEICNWLTVNPNKNCKKYSSENICILNIRGGEYRAYRDLLLPKSYWEHAIDHMKNLNPSMEFVIVTDDPTYTSKLLPQYPSLHSDIGTDYSIVHNARYLILANSSFSFFPAWTNPFVKKIIAPKFWSRHNVSDGFWACGFNLYKGWDWMDREGKLHSYETCVSEYESYRRIHALEQLGPRASTKIPFLRLRRAVARFRKRFRGY
jgi:hypothetical protein